MKAQGNEKQKKLNKKATKQWTGQENSSRAVSQSRLQSPLSSSPLTDFRGEVEVKTLPGNSLNFSCALCDAPCFLVSISLFWSYFQGFIDLCQDDKWVPVPSWQLCQQLRCIIFHCVYLWMEVMVCAPTTVPVSFHWPFWCLPEQQTV